MACLDYSILVNSCDAYKDAWKYFFYFLRINWHQDEIPSIYLNTEKETYMDDSIEVNVINAGNNKGAWGCRLVDALKKIESEFILMMLEDFFYESPIRTDIINKCVERMKKDNSILAFQLVPASEVRRNEIRPQKEVYSGFALRERKGEYTFIAGPTLWRKKDLLALTLRKDSPWTFEWYGSFRTRLYGKKIYCWKPTEEPIFDYDLIHGGAIHRGKWVGYKMKELESKFGIHIDYGDREVVDDWIKLDPDEIIKEPPHGFFQKEILSRIRGSYALGREKCNELYGLIRRFV